MFYTERGGARAAKAANTLERKAWEWGVGAVLTDASISKRTSLLLTALPIWA